jgi:DNA-binding NarL/FixJ family response regulator
MIGSPTPQSCTAIGEASCPVTAPKRCKVLIADDHAIVRSAVRPLLESIPGVEVVGEADNGITAIALAKKLQPDVLILDITMPHAGGITVLGEVLRFSPDTSIAVLTGIGSARTLAELQASGVKVILLKSCEPHELVRGFRAAIAGESYVAADARSPLAAGEALVTLTMRERQILSLAAQGRSNSEIAGLLNISQKTVDNHRTNLMQKLDVHSAAALAALAIREGLTDG